MEITTDYSNVKWQENGKLKLLIIVGTRPEIIRLGAVINKARKYFDCILAPLFAIVNHFSKFLVSLAGVGKKRMLYRLIYCMLSQ